MANNSSTQMTSNSNTEPQSAGLEAESPDNDTSSTETKQPSRLLRLPAELRNRIYELAVSADTRIDIFKSQGFLEPPLLWTSKAIRKEAIGFYYSANDFSVVVHSWDPDVYLLLAHKARVLEATYNVDIGTVGFRTARTGTASWKNLTRWFRLRHDGSETTRLRMPWAATGRRFTSAEENVTFGMIVMVDMMKASPWEDVKQVLELLRAGLVAVNPAWDLDQ